MTGKGSTRRPTDHEAFSAAFDRIFGMPTGWDNGLNQDYCKELGRWFASQPNARKEARDAADDLEQQLKSPGNGR